MHCAKNLRGMLEFPLGEMELSNVWQIFTKRPEGALSMDDAGGATSGFRLRHETRNAAPSVPPRAPRPIAALRRSRTLVASPPGGICHHLLLPPLPWPQLYSGREAPRWRSVSWCSSSRRRRQVLVFLVSSSSSRR
jgi:hypothetical protein